MSLVIKANGVFTFPPDQLCILEHNGKKLHCNVDLLIADYKEKQAERYVLIIYTSQMMGLIQDML